MIGSILLAVLVQTTPAVAGPNQLTDAERLAGWRLLFDGRTLAGWRGLGYDSVPTAHWVVVDGAIKKIASLAQGGQMTPAAVARGAISPNHSALGFEYQILDDDRHPDAQLATHRAGALYELFAPNERKHLRAVGEWNESKVIFRGSHGEHWLNGQKIVEFDLGTARMDSAFAASKYRSIAGFADRRKGHIVLQDHGDEVYFRDIKVREP